MERRKRGARSQLLLAKKDVGERRISSEKFFFTRTAELNEFLKRISVYWCMDQKLRSLVAATFFTKS